MHVLSPHFMNSAFSPRSFVAASAMLALAFLAGCSAKTDTQADVSIRAKDVVQRFYADYNGSTETDFKTRFASQRAYVSADFNARMAALDADSFDLDPIFCGSNPPDSVDIVVVPSNIHADGTATVTANQHFGSRVVPVRISLEPEKNGAFMISNVECLPREDMSSSSSSSSSDTSSTSSSSSSRSISSSSSSRSSSSSSSLSSSVTSSSSLSSSSRSQAKLGEFCGGIAGIQCVSGLTCDYEGTYPDAGGTCVN